MRAKNLLWESFLLRTGEPDLSMRKTPDKSPIPAEEQPKNTSQNCQGHQKEGKAEKLGQEQPTKR